MQKPQSTKCCCKLKLTKEIGIQVEFETSGRDVPISECFEDIFESQRKETSVQSIRNEHSYVIPLAAEEGTITNCNLLPALQTGKARVIQEDPDTDDDMSGSFFNQEHKDWSFESQSLDRPASVTFSKECEMDADQDYSFESESSDILASVDSSEECESNEGQEDFFESSDSDYSFETESLDSLASDDSMDAPEISSTCAEMYIVYESCIDELFTICKYCRNPVAEVKKFQEGSNLKVSVTCINHCTYTWSAQPSASGIAIGNLLTAASILFSGMTFQRFHQWSSLLKLATISESTFYAIQRTTLWPVIHEAWSSHQESLMKALKGIPLKLAGDGRCDSPGYTAKFGTYTLLDTDSDKIIDFQIVQKSEVTSSCCMEKEGLARCLKKTEDNGLKVNQLATDRHPQIVCYLKKLDIDHQFDVWHVSKSVVKKLSQKGKGKRCEDLRPWIRSVANHLWWSAATCEGNVSLLRDKWTSVIHHVANVHEWGHSESFASCEHDRLSQDEVEATTWLKKNSPPHEALKDVVTEKKLLSDLQHMTKFAHTGNPMFFLS